MQNGLATGICGPWGQVAINGGLTRGLQEGTGGVTMAILLPLPAAPLHPLLSTCDFPPTSLFKYVFIDTPNTS